MATGAKMSYNHFQNGKYGTLPQNPGKDMEITQDMHLKMSKKIAQLTKVIYALNTKNDEHEAIVNSIKEQHEEQMQQLLSETKTRVEQLKLRLGADGDQQKKLEQYEVMLADSERHKRAALAEFEDFKRRVEERELSTQTEHAQKLLAASHEVLTAKKEFQSRLAVLDSLREKLEAEKEEQLQAERARHQREIEQLTASLQSSSDQSAEQSRLQQQYQDEIAQLRDTCQNLTAEGQKLTEEHNAKMAKAQAFYEKELQALRDSQSASSNEEVERLREEQLKLTKDFALERSELSKRVEGLLEELSVREEEVNMYKDKLQQLEANMQNNNSSVVDLNKQLSEAKDETGKALTKLREVEAELSATRQRCEQQASDLMKKSTQLGELEAHKLQNEKTLETLQGQLSKAQDRIKLLESAKRALESQSSEQNKLQLEELTSLEKSLEELSTAKQKQMEQYEQKLRAAHEAHAQGEQKAREAQQAALEELRRKHENEAELMKRDLEEKLRRMKEELAVQLDAEMSRVLREKEEQEQVYEQSRATLMDRLARAEDEVNRLTAQVQDSTQGLGTATSELNSLRDQAKRLKSDLESTKAELRTTKNRVSTLQTDYDNQKNKYDKKLKDSEEDAKRRLEELNHDLDAKWSETMRKQCQKIAEELTSQKDEDKRAAIEQLTKMKDAEIDSQRYTLQQKINDLKRQLATVQSTIDGLKESHLKEIEQFRAGAEEENRQLRTELLSEAEEYARKIEEMESLYTKKIADLEAQRETEVKAKEEQLRSEHLADMQVQLTAHKATLDTVRQTAQKSQEMELERLKADHQAKLEALRNELAHVHSLELETTNRSHQQQLSAARMELERAIDVTKQKEAEHQMKVGELEDDIRHREQTIKTLDEETKNLQQGVNDLARELEAKGKEVLRIRSEMTKAAKAREEKLVSQHKDNMSTLSAEYLREKQGMLMEFTEAQQLLKDKISAMQLMLEEAEERYKNRESREEDLELIKELQLTIQEREHHLRKLTEEKRKFQMELVNRETNFNKVFNANPQVGILNPLGAVKVKSKQKNEKSVPRYGGSNGSLSSIGSGSTRLEPLPHSPLHEERLNHTKPLPPTTKKFVK